jgi:Tfp pilus assembly protein PilZ
MMPELQQNLNESEAAQNLNKNEVIIRLLNLMDNITDEQQLMLFKKLFKDNLSNQLVKRIIDMNDHQRLVLMKHLEEMVAKTENGEKRKYPRKDCLINVNFAIQGPRFSSYILDINPYGAFIETNQSLAIGQEMKLTFSSPENRKSLNITGTVIRKDMNGVGVRFHNLDKHDLNTIRSFVENGEAVYTINS